MAQSKQTALRREAQAGAVPCAGRGNLLALLSWEVGGILQSLPGKSRSAWGC